MGYTIWYGESPKMRRKKALRKWGGVLTILLAAALLIGAIRWDGWGGVGEMLFPGAAQALESFSDHLRQGESIGAAVTAFCQEIVDHGGKDGN